MGAKQGFISNERFHSLDALRAFALLLGVVFHSALSHLLPPGLWAVGTSAPSMFLGWFVYYTHSFRMELFFLLAGFFAALVIRKRGLLIFIRDRARRILLMFVVLLYPMKFALGALWLIGGQDTGWLKLPAQVASLPWWQLSLGGLRLESWPDIQLTHLWFLYYLSWITALFLAARWLCGRIVAPDLAWRIWLQNRVLRMASSWPAPLLLGLAMTPLMAMMRRPEVETPDRSLALNFPVLAIYGGFFTLGWFFHRHSDLLSLVSRRWKLLLPLGIAISLLGSLGAGLPHAAGAGTWLREHALLGKWAASFGTSLTMALSVAGWIGCFLAVFNRPSEKIRYVADASYWIYLAHLPLVVALQIGFSAWALPWWVQWPVLNALALSLLLLSYHWWVRFNWVGAWLNGRRSKGEEFTPGSSGGHVRHLAQPSLTDR